MSLTTRLTHAFGIEHPIVLAPMDYVSDARLAGAVSAAGGLGLLGGGYVDEAWIRSQLDAVSPGSVGCGFITWTLKGNEHVLDRVLERRPAAVFLSFADPAPYAPAIRAAGIPLICQVHDLEQARRAIDCGASVVAAQGGEAGGHGLGTRSTFTLVPEVADLLHERAPEVLLVAAGGVTDGRGLAAALALGADGVLVGTRFWAAHEAAIPRAAQVRALELSGDHTIRQQVYDVVRGKNWPAQYTGRVLHNAFVRQWNCNESALREDLAAARERFHAAVEAEDYDTANLIVGEGIGQISSVQSAAEIISDMSADAEAIFTRRAPALTPSN